MINHPAAWTEVSTGKSIVKRLTGFVTEDISCKMRGESATATVDARLHYLVDNSSGEQRTLNWTRIVSTPAAVRYQPSEATDSTNIKQKLDHKLQAAALVATILPGYGDIPFIKNCSILRAR